VTSRSRTTSAIFLSIFRAGRGAALPRLVKRSVADALQVHANQLNEGGEQVHDRCAFDSLGHEHDDEKGGRVKLFDSSDNRHHIAGKGNPWRDYKQRSPIFTKPSPDPLFAFGVMERDDPAYPVLPKRYPTEAPRTDAGISTSRMTNGLTFSLSSSAIVGSAGIGSTDEVALTRNSSSKP